MNGSFGESHIKESVRIKNVRLPSIVLLGGAGMLGHKVLQRLRSQFPDTVCTLLKRPNDEPFSRIPLFQTGRNIGGVDVQDFEGLSRLLQDLKPEFIVNCVGIIKQRESAKAYVPTIVLNSLFPHQLADLCSGWGGKLIHFSTDCVFSGRRGMYRETDVSDAEDLYGRTKFLGETTETNALTLRTSIIGRELLNHRSLLDWFLSNRGGTVQGYKKSIYSGVTTNHLADIVYDVITRYGELNGVYQVASEPIAKYDLLCLIRDAFKLEIQIEATGGEDVDRSLDGSKFSRATGYKCPPWRELVQQLATDPTPYREWLECGR